MKYKVGQVITFQGQQWIIRKLLSFDKSPWLALYRSDGQYLESMLIPTAWLDEESRQQDLIIANEVI